MWASLASFALRLLRFIFSGLKKLAVIFLLYALARFLYGLVPVGFWALWSGNFWVMAASIPVLLYLIGRLPISAAFRHLVQRRFGKAYFVYWNPGWRDLAVGKTERSDEDGDWVELMKIFPLSHTGPSLGEFRKSRILTMDEYLKLGSAEKSYNYPLVVDSGQNFLAYMAHLNTFGTEPKDEK